MDARELRAAPPIVERGISVAEAASLLGVSRIAVYRLIRNGGLPSYRVGKRVLTLASECEKWRGRQLSQSVVGVDTNVHQPSKNERGTKS